jgi:hypothetical protein
MSNLKASLWPSLTLARAQGGMLHGIKRTVTKGEPLPPPLKSGQQYKLTDPTKHGGKRGK